MENILGTEVKGFELRELIGAGGFGAVYRAYQPSVGREVAIKVILPEYANAPTFIRRFETEAQLVARLEHPYIVPLYDYWRDPKGAYLVMRYLRGGSLTGLIRRNGPLSFERAGVMLNQIASALAVAHASGVVHRDLKPDNILLDEAGNHYLSDFGIAKDVGGKGINLTQTGAIIGSPAYLSPEQITGEGVTALSDVYSLGILLHFALTGEHPFPGKTPTAMLIHQMQDPMPALQLRRDEVPEAVEEVLQRTTAKDPGSRYSSVMELAIAFNRALRDSNISTSAIQRLGIKDTGSVIITGIAATPQPNPYKGLKAFEEADSENFFGREQLTQRLLQRLMPRTGIGESDHLLVVVGPSGSGKSSVVKAGVIPELRNGAIPATDTTPGSENWFYLEMVPGTHPMEELEAALLRVAVNPPESLLRQLEDDKRGLLRALKRVLPDDNSQLVLFIDQFEEVFTLSESEEKRNHFLNSLMTAVMEPRNRLRLILTLRADFYDRPLSYYEFGELVRKHTEVVLPLNAQELESAIVLPARQAGVVLEGGLASEIAADVREQPGALPLLQYALMQLYERREGSRLTLKAYHDIGGAMGALARRAEEIYQELNLEQKDTARQVFLRLVTLGEGQEDTRRRILRGELNALGNQDAINSVIETFGGQRLLTFDNDPQTREPTIEVAHEALIREWRSLREWLDSAREDLRTQRRLNHAALEWHNANKDASYLATGTRLDQFEAMQHAQSIAMNEIETAYVHRSLEQREARQRAAAEQAAREAALEERAQQRLRLLLTVVSVAAVIALALAILSGALFRRSQASLALADDRAVEAQAQALSASALNVLDNFQPTLALNLAIEAGYRQGELTPVKTSLARAAYAPGPIRQLNPLDDASLVSVSFNADGTRLAGGSANGHVLVLNPADSSQMLEIADAHTTTAVNDEGVEETVPLAALVAYHPTGEQIASAAGDGMIKVWDANSGDLLLEWQGHTAAVNALTFSPDGTTLLSGGDDAALYQWDISTGTQVRAFEGHVGRVLSADFSANGQRIISSTADDPNPPENTTVEDRVARVWDAQTGALLSTLRAPGTGWLRGAALNTDGTIAAVASYDPNEFGGTIRLWNVANGQVQRMLIGHTDVITTIDFSPDGATLLSGGWDRTVRRWDVNTGVQIQRFDVHEDRLLNVAYAPDGVHAVTAGGRARGTTADTRAFLVALEQRNLVHQLDGHTNWLFTAAYSPDGSLIATGSGHLNVPEGDNSIRLWDAATGEQIAMLQAHTNTVTNVAFSADGSRLVSSSHDLTAMIWDWQAGTVLQTLTGHERIVTDATFNPDGTLVLTASEDGTVRLWDVATGEQVRVINAHGDAESSASAFQARFNADGTQIVSGGSDSLVKLWNAETGELLHEMPGHSGWVSTVNFSPDGIWAISGADNDLIVWEVATGEEAYRLVGHKGFVYGGVFSPDNEYILSGASDTTVRLWEAATGEEIQRFTGHTNWVLDVAFSPDGTRAVSAAEDNTARVWRITTQTDQLIAWAQQNRYVPEFTCAERDRYNIEPLCEGYRDSISRGREGR